MAHFNDRFNDQISDNILTLLFKKSCEYQNTMTKAIVWMENRLFDKNEYAMFVWMISAHNKH